MRTRRCHLAFSIVALLCAAIACACSDEHSQQCREICKRTDQCADSAEDPNFKFDEGECRAACTFLEKDDKGKTIVATHSECVAKATSCDAVLACD